VRLDVGPVSGKIGGNRERIKGAATDRYVFPVLIRGYNEMQKTFFATRFKRKSRLSNLLKSASSALIYG